MMRRERLRSRRNISVCLRAKSSERTCRLTSSFKKKERASRFPEVEGCFADFARESENSGLETGMVFPTEESTERFAQEETATAARRPSKFLTPARKPLGEHFWETGIDDLFLGLFQIIFNAAEDDVSGGKIVDHVAGTPVTIAGLSHGAGVYEIFFTSFQSDLLGWDLGDAAFAHVDAWNMGVSMEAEISKLVGKVRHGVKLVGDVVPGLRLIEGGVDDGEVFDLTHHAEVTKPFFVIVVELVAGPLESGRGDRVHVLQSVVITGDIIVIAFYHRPTSSLDFFETADRIGIVAYDVSHADVIGAALLLGVGEDGLKSFKVSMNVSKEGNAHGSGKEREKGEWAR